MSNYSEDVLFALLSDTEGLEVLIQDGMPMECIPTADARPIVQWCIDYFFESDMTRAPSVEAIKEMWGQHLEDLEIDLGDGTETDTMESAIEALKKTYVEFKTQEFTKSLATKMSKADPTEKVSTLLAGAEDLYTLSAQFERRSTISPSSVAATLAMNRYDERVASPAVFKGMSYGIAEIDQHYYGLHPGELAILAAGPKVGKSWYAAIMAIANWTLGMQTLLITLENSQEMTWDRILCLKARVPYREFQRGGLSMEQDQAMRRAEKEFSTASNELLVISPDDGKRTARAIVESARLKSAEALIIDQLTFMEHPHPRGLARNEVIRDITHDLKNGINGRMEVPCLLNHQINREGVKAAQKTGFYEMYHLAEGSEVERTADAIHAIYQPLMEKAVNRAFFQGLGCRREESESWSIAWAPANGTPPSVYGKWTPAPPSDSDKDAY